jgi:SWIM zinc finger
MRASWCTGWASTDATGAAWQLQSRARPHRLMRHRLLKQAQRLHDAGEIKEVEGRIFRVRAPVAEYTVTWGEDARWSCTCPAPRGCSHIYAAARTVMLEDPEEHAAVEGLWDGLGD